MSVAVCVRTAVQSVTDAYLEQLRCLHLSFYRRLSPTLAGWIALPSGSEFQSQTLVARNICGLGIDRVLPASLSYVKVTMARKGFLRPNERLFAPIVYLARETDISFMSNARRAALVQSIPLPSPLEAPDDWESRSEERQVRKGLFGIGKKTAYKAALLLPKPLVFGSESRQMGTADARTDTKAFLVCAELETLPFYVELSSDDNATLNKLGPASIVVRLVQRTTVCASSLPDLTSGGAVLRLISSGTDRGARSTWTP